MVGKLYWDTQVNEGFNLFTFSKHITDKNLQMYQKRN